MNKHKQRINYFRGGSSKSLGLGGEAQMKHRIQFTVSKLSFFISLRQIVINQNHLC